MAELYLAKDTQGDRFAVIKRILPYLAKEREFVQMFLDEARIASQLHHPNIITVYELGHLERSIFLAMEFVDGVDLRKILQEEQRRDSVVPPNIAAWLVARLCDGLHYAHNKVGVDGRALKVIHRDVSPQNLMVGFNGAVKLVDFGISKAGTFMERSRPGVIKGKFLYLAPEQLSQGRVDHRADLFAVGTMLYEVTTGQSPFFKPTTEGVMYAIRTEDPPAPHVVRPSIPVTLSNIIMRCLMKDRTRRYQTASQIQADLEGFLRNEAKTHTEDVRAYVSRLFGSDDERTPHFVPASHAEAAKSTSNEKVAADDPEVTRPVSMIQALAPLQTVVDDSEETQAISTSALESFLPDDGAMTQAHRPHGNRHRGEPTAAGEHSRTRTALAHELARAFVAGGEQRPSRPYEEPPVGPPVLYESPEANRKHAPARPPGLSPAKVNQEQTEAMPARGPGATAEVSSPHLSSDLPPEPRTREDRPTRTNKAPAPQKPAPRKKSEAGTRQVASERGVAVAEVAPKNLVRRSEPRAAAYASPPETSNQPRPFLERPIALALGVFLALSAIGVTAVGFYRLKNTAHRRELVSAIEREQQPVEVPEEDSAPAESPTPKDETTKVKMKFVAPIGTEIVDLRDSSALSVGVAYSWSPGKHPIQYRCAAKGVLSFPDVMDLVDVKREPDDQSFTIRCP